MKNLVIILLSVIFYSKIFSQNYWQQEVNYSIQVKLDDIEHKLSAYEEIEYVNNSPSTLNEIYFHLWPNAYKNEKTALAKQLYENKEKELRFASEKDRGWIDSLDFKVNGTTVKWELDKTNIDICKITLAQPLLPGGRITITTPFVVKIPNANFSRLGHVGQAYQITQWYPKPAVYDKNGWNTMPYLDQGEFYSEYGSFDVKITLPETYVIGATGDLQTSNELEFLSKKAEETRVFLDNLKEVDKKNSNRKVYSKIESKKDSSQFVNSKQNYKTVHFKQTNVHDFAWFADKNFHVLKGEVILPHSKRKVNTWAMFTSENAKYWKNALEYLHDGTYYYSLWNGDYPYNNVTAVDGTISAGGGMEYPTITVIGNVSSKTELEIVIVHEVGHNWFYGILGTNERVHGWMDEGLNTLNEMRYVQTKYPANKQFSDMVLNGRFHFNDLNHHDMGDISYRMIAMLGLDQAIETHSAKFTSMNYGVIMYQKTGLIFHYLKAVLGDSLFDASMQFYFDTWKYKHPQPEDLKSCLETKSKQNLSWLFSDLVQTTKPLDFKIKKVKFSKKGTEITLKNKSKLKAPAIITLFAGSEKHEIKTEAFSNKLKINSPVLNADKVVIDENKQIPELFRSNNTWTKAKIFHKNEPIKLEFLIGDHEREKTNLFWSPAIGVNNADKFMLGAALHNLGVPFKSSQVFIAPMYSFGANRLSGIAEFSKTYHPGTKTKIVRTGISAKSFALESARNFDAYYSSIAPYLFVKFGKNDKMRTNSNTILVQTIYRYDQFRSSLPSLLYLPTKLFDNYTDHFGFLMNYQFSYDKRDVQFQSSVKAEYFDNVNNDDQVFRTSYEFSIKYNYLKNKMKRNIELRYFIGKIWQYNNTNFYGDNLDYSYALSGAQGNQDLFLEEYFFNRSASSISSTQRIENMGAFKSVSNYGRTNDFLTSFNLYAQLPIKPNLFGIFLDYGLVNTYKVESLYNMGLAFKLGKIVSIYFPVYASKELENFYEDQNYLSRIRFSFKINIVNKPLKLSELL